MKCRINVFTEKEFLISAELKLAFGTELFERNFICLALSIQERFLQNTSVPFVKLYSVVLNYIKV